MAPYLRQIDRSRMYSNQGPLVTALQKRLAARFELADGSVVAASSGTAALVAAILAHAGPARPERPYAICPAYTFVATAAAVSQCGYEPYLADVSPETWTLDPDRLAEHPMLDRVGVVVPVCAYGRPLDVEGWARFQHATGIRVVIDAAAAVEALADGKMHGDARVPLALSFHATKAFGCGEGGCVVWPDPALAARTMQATNFGFMGSRNSQGASLNGKMSEYHAAVALAELDGWAGKRADFDRSTRAYRAAFLHEGLPSGDLVVHPQIASNYILYRCTDPARAEDLRRVLEESGIEARFWYGGGMHMHDHLREARRDALPVTEDLSRTLLGLPMGSRMAAADIARVVSALAAARGRVQSVEIPSVRTLPAIA
ncbi:putative PLP-dependent enzyme possibly involved in cell wall biogenesis [Novosphingobium sp. AP12]|nr:putative PLP-dependent enzyme possibly involved in cell wall biogenesis [Novosphingobium sp. AP12]